VHKHVAGVKYEDIGLTFGTGMSRAFYTWMKDTLDKKFARRSGALVTMSYDYKEAARLNYSNAFISEIGFPALDAASKDGVQFTLSLSPERTSRAAASNAPVAQHESVALQKKWLASNFRFELNGVDATKVSRIDPIIIKLKTGDSPAGDARDYAHDPPHLEISDLAVTIADSGAQDWYKWLEDFVVKGNNGDAQEKTGTISYLSPDLRTTLFKLTLRHVGIVKIDPESVEAGSEAVRRVKAELYVEDVGLDFDSSAGF
jgi:hypothetical protein